MNVIIILLGIIGNFVIGSAVCATLDTKDRVFFNWMKNDPTGGIMCFLFISFWPIMAFLMLRYKYIHLKEK